MKKRIMSLEAWETRRLCVGESSFFRPKKIPKNFLSHHPGQEGKNDFPKPFGGRAKKGIFGSMCTHPPLANLAS